MLDQVSRWIAIAGTVVNALLLLRILALRLHQTYLFVTLFCAVNLVLDAGGWLAGWNSQEAGRLSIYSHFAMAVVFPLAVWDVFQGISQQVEKFRRLHTLRLISGLVITALFAMILAAVLDDQDLGGINSSTVRVSVLLWVTTSTACLMFLWNMRRYMKQQQIPLESNTGILWLFFVITLFEELVGCVLQLSSDIASTSTLTAAFIVLNAVDLGLMSWCAIRLRASGRTAPAQQNAGA